MGAVLKDKEVCQMDGAKPGFFRQMGLSEQEVHARFQVDWLLEGYVTRVKRKRGCGMLS